MKCAFCNQEMTPGVGCTAFLKRPLGGAGLDRVPYPADATLNCHDCYCPPGTLHHPGCDVERCPKCGGQAISCECPIRVEAVR